MKKVYFACSIFGGGDTSQYQAIIQAIKDAGGNVISEIFANDAINFGGSPLSAEDIFERDIDMIQDADLIIAEVSNPSLGVGYELGYAQSLGKPILALYNEDSPKKLSAMVAGNFYVSVEIYSSGNIPTEKIDLFIKS
jgi:nucleoside 2-deoxyribosyltransferase